jgi:hypothetical protein
MPPADDASREFGDRLAGDLALASYIEGLRSSHPGRLWVRRALGPPAQGAAAVHTTPISAMIGEPDISVRMPSASWVIHSGPPK